MLTLHDVNPADNQIKPLAGFERKDVWNMMWDSVRGSDATRRLIVMQENEEMLAIMEKTRMFVLRGTEAEVCLSLKMRLRSKHRREN